MESWIARSLVPIMLCLGKLAVLFIVVDILVTDGEKVRPSMQLLYASARMWLMNGRGR